MTAQHAAPTLRRARPLLGTLVEVGICSAGPTDAIALAACVAAFDAISAVQRALSRFDADSDIARFNAAPGDACLDIQADTVTVLAAAQRLFVDSDRAFDVTLGSGPAAWAVHGTRLHKRDARVRIDLGGIGKGLAVDRAVQTLREAGVAGGWVNAGGDLRCFGDASVALSLRDEQRGGTVEFGSLREGAFATSWFGAHCRAPLSGGAARVHASVAAPQCLWADALTKVVAATGDVNHRCLVTHGARAWLH